MSKKDPKRHKRHRVLKSAAIVAPLAAPLVIRALDARRSDGTLPREVALELEHVECASLDGTRLHLTVCGEGPETVYFVHGWTCNESIFRFQQEHFSRRYRVVSLELRGHGASAIPADLSYHPEKLAEDLKAAVDATGQGPFAIAGHSMGGFTAFKFYERFAPEYEGRLKGMVIIDSTGTDLVEGIVLGRLVRHLYPIPLASVMEFIGRHNTISQAIKHAVRDSSIAYAIVRWGAFGGKPTGTHVEHVREMVLATHMTTLSLAAKACLDFHFDYYLPNVSVPVVLLVGDRDKLTNRSSNERTARLLPDARLKVFEGAGHCTLLERRDEFNAELEAFLEDLFDTRSM